MHWVIGQAGGTSFTGVWVEYHQHSDCIVNTSRTRDARQYTVPGLVGGTDGKACVQTDRMGAGFALGNERIPLLQFLAPVGGLVSSLGAEAASLLHFLRRVPALLETSSRTIPRQV